MSLVLSSDCTRKKAELLSSMLPRPVMCTPPTWLSPPECVEYQYAVEPGFVDAPLDAEDLARALTSYRGQPTPRTPPMRYGRVDADGDNSAYVLDGESGMVYILA